MAADGRTLSVVIPALNEQDRLPPTLAAVRAYLDTREGNYEVLVVDDGSADLTAEVVGRHQQDWPQLQLLRLASNQGKGAAVQRGMLASRGELRLFTDADLSTPIEELVALEQRIAAGADIAVASRALPESRVERHQPYHRELMGKTYNRALRLLVLPELHDTQCGFKLFTADAARACFGELRCPRFGFDAEVLLRAVQQGLEVAEVPVSWRNADGTRVSSLRDGGRMLLELIKLRAQLHHPPVAATDSVSADELRHQSAYPR